jgi:UDP-N-acetylglucosamine 2-epimerase (non-hydrolysing)
MKIRKNLIRQLKKKDRIIHIVLIGTKPDIIKQAPLIHELRKQGEYALVVHSGQHHSWNLSVGLEKEFNITPDINLEVSGSLYEQQAQIIHSFGKILAELKKVNRLIVPYIYGDTTTAVAAGIASFANLISTAHVEAGLRTLSPPKRLIMDLLGEFDPYRYFQDLRHSGEWRKGSYEPYPEQFDTRASAPSVGVHFAPVRINAENLINEGYSPERVFVVGNPVVDALEFSLRRINNSKILDKFPILRKGSVIRFCIHRRENIISQHRFLSIYEAMRMLVKEGYIVVLISLGATEKALKTYGLKKEVLELARKYKNFIYSSVWPYYTDVVALMKLCACVVTDSGSIQEETNSLGIPGVVLRFNSDRPEAIFAGSNILAPPICSKAIVKIIKAVIENSRLRQEMLNSPKIYGRKVSHKMVRIIKKAIDMHNSKSFNIFELLEHDRLGLSKQAFWKKGGTTW